MQPNDGAYGTTTHDTCSAAGVAMAPIERVWKLFLEHRTLRNFDRIYPAVNDQFGPLDCAGVSVQNPLVALAEGAQL